MTRMREYTPRAMKVQTFSSICLTRFRRIENIFQTLGAKVSTKRTHAYTVLGDARVDSNARASYRGLRRKYLLRRDPDGRRNADYPRLWDRHSRTRPGTVANAAGPLQDLPPDRTHT